MHTHTYLSVYLAIYRQQKCGNENIFFFEKILKKILIPRINCSDTKYIHMCVYLRQPSGQDGQCVHYDCMESKTRVSFELSWILEFR